MGALKQEITGLETRLSGDIWKEDPQGASQLGADLKNKKKTFDTWVTLGEYSQLLAEHEHRESLTPADRQSLEETVIEMEKILEAEEKRKFFSGEYDRFNAFLSIKAGVGGSDAEDFCSMLLRMYLRYAEIKGWTASLIHENYGEGGVKDVTVEIAGEFVFGHLKHESGTHRLVRLSPFKSADSRQTSFALVEVMPVFDAASKLAIDPEDIRIDTFRASGAGGQKVNKTESAIRITHIPTGISVSCQNERSQHQNKEKAMAFLRSKLEYRQREEQKALENSLKTSDESAKWGSQIRNYVLHPYTLVKDLRSGYEDKNVGAVLEGHLDPIIESLIMLKDNHIS